MGFRGADSPDSLVTAATVDQLAWCQSDLSSAIAADAERSGAVNYELASLAHLLPGEPGRLSGTGRETEGRSP